MTPARKNKMMLIMMLILILSAAVLLILYALRQNINLFYAPVEIAAHQAPLNHPIRIGGMVEKKSLIRTPNSLKVRFKITDFKSSVTVEYEGILPDLFREGQGIVAEGVLTDSNHFSARYVLAKHDANYMPPQVKQLLTKEPAHAA